MLHKQWPTKVKVKLIGGGGGGYMSSASCAGDLPDFDIYYNLAMFVNNSREHVGMTPESVPLAWHTSVCENVVGTWPVM